MEMALLELALEGIAAEEGSTSAAAVACAKEVVHTSFGHVDHGQKATRPRQESWIAECGRRLEDMDAPYAMPP